MSERMRVGVVSDTHGLLRPEVMEALAGVEHILHAGDVGDGGILGELGRVAPVTAVRGNVDTSGACGELPLTEAVELAGRLFYLVHRVEDLDLDPVAAGVAAVVSGHSHRFGATHKGGVLYLNPGSIGPRRFRLPITLALLTVGTGELVPEMLTIPAK